MGRVAIVEFNDVATIANKMMVAGGKPTARAILAELGIGSMSTIQTHFKQWQADQALHLPAINHEILSPDVTRAINLTIFTKIQEATANLDSTLEEEKATSIQIQKEYEQLSVDHAIQLTALSYMETQYAELVGRAEMLESEVKRSATELANERKSAESARTTLAIANHQLVRLHQLETEVEMQRSELKLANDNAAEFNKASAVAEAKLEAALASRK
jgi:hypothetical protein